MIVSMAGLFGLPEEKVKTRYPLRDNGFLWSCYPDLNRRPHPYQDGETTVR